MIASGGDQLMREAQGSPEVSGLLRGAIDLVSEENVTFFEDVPSQSPLECLEHFCRSNQSFQRLAYCNGIAAAAAAPTAAYSDCVEVLLPLVEHLARDHEPEIRSVAVKQIHGLGTALYQKDADRSMRDIEGSLLVCAQQCALDDEDEVSQAAVLAFQQLVQLLPPARATAASKRAVDRLEVRGTDDGTLAAVRLLAHTVAFWTPEALRRHVPRYISRWATHRDFAVREAVATCMSLIMQPIPLQLCQQALLPAFYQLCRDSNWRVRRACSLDLPRSAAVLQQRTAQWEAAHGSSSGSSPSRSSLANNECTSSSHHDALPEEGQRYGCCSSRACSCLSMVRYCSEFSSQSSSNLLAASIAAAGAPQRNRSSPSLMMRPPATTAQIMTKHPMHSSLIMDGSLSGSSSANSMPGSPSSSTDLTSLAYDSLNDQQQQHYHHHHHHHHHDHDHQTERTELGGQHHAVCKLEQSAPVLHDCWCALRQCMELPTADSSHWVKVAALSGLGQVLVHLPPCQLGQLLLGRFTSMAGSTVVIYEVSVALACAQAFGQLAVALGPERWHDMRDAWHALQASRDPQVLCEVVSCLPRLMTALGPALTHQELLPSLAALLQAHLTWIAGQLVAVMADLLECLPPSGQELVLKTLPQLAASSGERSRSWRLRRDLAQQLGRMAAAAGPDAIETTLWPVAMTLCSDPVAAVRNAAASEVGSIIAALPAGTLQQELSNVSGGFCCCNGSRLATSSFPSSAAAAGAPTHCDAIACAAAAGAANHEGCSNSSDSSSSNADGGADRASEHSSARWASDEQDHKADSSSQPSTSKSRTSKGRGFGVRFAEHGSSAGSNHSSRFAPGVLAAGMGMDSSSSSSNHHMDYDMELPSALAPAPAGCFNAHSDSGSDDPDAAGDDSTSSSGLSSSRSSSRSSSTVSDSASSSESGSDLGSDSESSDDEEDASGRSQESWLEGAGTQPSGQDSGQQQQEEEEVPPALAVQQRPRMAMHPAMMPVGALTALGAVSVSASEPRAVPAARQRSKPQLRASSTGDLLRMGAIHAAAAAAESRSGEDADKQHYTAADRQARRHSIGNLPSSLPAARGRLMDGDSSDDEPFNSRSSSCSELTERREHCLPFPEDAAPHQYLACLVEHFGCSSSYQQRQLFVTLVMGLLASCHEVLSCAQQAALLDRLEALAHDKIPGVRYAVATALADIKAQAAALTDLTNQQQQQQDMAPELQPPTQQQQQQEEDGVTTAAASPQEQGQEQEQRTNVSGGSTGGQHQSDQEELQQTQEQQPQQQQEQGQPQGQQQQQQQDTSGSGIPGVPRGAHPLLGYQAYVQQLARQSSISSEGSSSGGSSGGGAASTRSTATSTTASLSASKPPPVPRTGSGSSSRSSIGKASSPTPAMGASGKSTAAAAAASKGQAAGSGEQGEAVPAEAKAAEWLMKLSSCQQLERLMHVVALTTGPV